MNMNAVVLEEPYKFNVKPVEMPKIKTKTEVLVKTKAVGVCGSDMEAYYGKHAHVTMPAVLGHEVVGEVVEIGEDVTHIKVGDRVVLEAIEYCGTCYACRHGQHNVCRHLKVRGFAIDGGMAEYFVSEENKLHTFPDTIEWKHAVMIEPYTVAAQVHGRAQTAPGDTVLVHGLGPAGLCIATWAKQLGAVVMGSDMVAKRLEIAKEAGIDYVFNPAQDDVAQCARDITDGEGPNVIVEACGVPALLTQAMELVSPAGRVVPIAFNFNPTGIATGFLNVKEVSIVGSRLQAGKYAPVIEALPQLVPNMELLVTHTFPYEQTNEAYELAGSRDPAVGKVVILF